MTRLSRSLAIILGVAPALAMPSTATASPDTPQAVLDAAPYTLRVDAPCASTITVEGAEAQDIPVRLDTPEDVSPAGLSLTTSAHEAVLSGQSCDSSALLHVRPGTAIVATLSRFGSLHVTGVNGPVSLTQQSSSEATFDQATALILKETGFGGLKLGWLHGPATLTTSGSGNVVIARVDAPRLDAALNGFGSVTLQAGRIDDLSAQVSGSGHLRFDGVAGNVTLAASGFGGISVSEVTGEIHQKASSPATISLQHSASQQKTGQATHPILTLPDGTIITARSLIRPDGTVIAFDDASENADGQSTHHPYHRLFWIMALVTLVFTAYRNRDRLVRFLPPSRHGLSSTEGGTPFDQAKILALQAHLSRLDQRLGAIEHCVTSRDFRLHRQFHDLARGNG